VDKLLPWASSQLEEVQAPPGLAAERWLYSIRLECFYLRIQNHVRSACSEIMILNPEIINLLQYSLHPTFCGWHKYP